MNRIGQFLRTCAIVVNVICAGFSAPPPPQNDDWANATDLGSGGAPIIEGTTLGATAAAGEPYLQVNGPPIVLATVWYKWTATSSDSVTLVPESGFPRVWTFRSEAGKPGTFLSGDNAPFFSEPGATYYFAATTPEMNGPFRLRLLTGASPLNDFLVNAIELPSASSMEVIGSGFGATIEPDEPNKFSVLGSVWYKWTPPFSGVVEFRYAKDRAGAVVRLFSGDGVSAKSLTSAASDADPNRPHVFAGVVYYLGIYSRDQFRIRVELTSSPPPNDSVASAMPLDFSGGIARAHGTTLGATRDASDPNEVRYSDTVWYKWTPETSGSIQAKLEAPDELFSWYRPELMVFREQTNPFRLSKIEANGDSFGVSAGETYYIAVSYGSGLFDLVVRPSASPRNDNFANATEYSAWNGAIRGVTTIGATLEPDEPHPPGAVGSVWYKFATSGIRISADPPNANEKWAIYSGSSLASLDRIDPPYLIEGEPYYYLCLYSMSNEGSTFDFPLRFDFFGPNPNDYFSEATLVIGRSNVLGGIWEFGLQNAGTELGEPVDQPGTSSPMDATLWWKYIPSEAGWLLTAPPMYSSLSCSVYSGSELTSLNRLSSGLSVAAVLPEQTYYIQENVFSTVRLVFSDRSENDNFNQAPDISPLIIEEYEGYRTNIAGHTGGASSELGEPLASGGMGTTVWYRWTPPFDGVGRVAMVPAGERPSVLTVFKGTSLDNIQSIGTNEVQLSFKHGESFYFQIDATSSSPAAFCIDIYAESFSAKAKNDNLPEALEITDEFVRGRANVRNATLEPGEPSHMSVAHKSLWWRWRAPTNGCSLQFWAQRSHDGLTGLAVYRGGPNPENLERIVSGEGTGVLSLPSIDLGPSEEIYIAVAVPSDAEDQVIFFGESSVPMFRSSQTIYFPLPPALEFQADPIPLDVHADSGLPVTLTVGRGPATIQGNSLFLSGPGIVSIEATQPGNDRFIAATKVVRTFGVRKRSQTIDFSRVNALTDPVKLNATSSVGLPVQFQVLSGAATLGVGNTLLNIGEGPITVRALQPGDSVTKPATPVEQTFVLRKSQQTIQFVPLPDVPAGGGSIHLQAAASSGLPVLFTLLSGNATLNGSSLILNGSGMVTIRASQPGSDQFEIAPSVDRSFNVTGSSQTITFPDLPPLRAGSPPVQLVATTSSGLPVRFELVSGSGLLNGDSLTPTGAGTLVIRATQAGNSVYLPVSIDREFTVTSKTAQSILFDSLPNIPVTTGSIPLQATASSGLPVTFILLTGTGSISGATLMIKGAGQITVRASQSGNDQFEAAAAVERSFEVTRLAQTITFGDLPPLHLGDAPRKLVATASSGLPVAFQVVSGPGQLVEGALGITSAGTIIVRALQAGNDTYLPTTLDRQFVVAAKLGQTIQFDVSSNVPITTKSLQLQASASSGLPVALSLITGNATLSGATLTINSAGVISLRASQSGNEEFDAAAPVERSFEVTRLPQTIRLAEIPSLHFGDPAAKLTATADSGLSVSLQLISGSAELAGDLLKPISAGSVTIRAAQSGNDTWLPAPDLDTTVTIGKASQTITFSPPAERLTYDGRVRLVASAGSGLPVTFRVVAGPGELSDDVLYVNGLGQIIIEAAQAGDNNYESASIQQTITVLGPPELAVRYSNNKLILTWPEGYAGFKLESAAAIGGPWAPLVPDISSQKTAEITLDVRLRFFRLKTGE